MTQAVGLRAAKKLETWRALRAAAVELVTERGYDGVCVEEIASAANVSRSTLFNYFDSKESLLLDPDPEDPARWRARAAARPDDEPLWDSLREIIVGCVGPDEPKLLLRKSIIVTSPATLESAWAASEPFRIFVREWAAGRLTGTDDDVFQVALVVNTAFAVVHTAYRAWQPDEGADRFQGLLRAGFDVAGAGFAKLGPPPSVEG